VFQDERFESLLVYSGVGALDISVPILLFAVIFGLSTDYSVFLLSRVAEARETEPGSRAIALGLERSGRIITAAAILFAVAMGSFIFSQMVFIKEVAVGTALAVLVDATLVRAFLMPALMQLCGEVAWWSPGPLARLARLRP
jgi:putative drug exporter of the RND superfamily